MAATLSKYYFHQERSKLAEEYVDKIIELKKSGNPDAVAKILSIKRIIRAMYNINY